MKNNIFITTFVSALLLAASCDMSETVTEPSGDGTVTVSFGVDIPGLASGETTDTKAFADQPGKNIKNLYLAVFDNEGYLSQYVKAECLDGYPEEDTDKGETTYPAKRKKFKAVLKVSDITPCIVHFIANAPAYVPFGSEEDVLTAVTAYANAGNGEAGPDVYWDKIDLSDGIQYQSSTDFSLISTSAVKFREIGLVRNFAEFTVQSNAPEFTLVNAKILNVPDRGFAAPYNRSTGSFLENYGDYSVEELVGLGYDGAVPSTAEYITDAANPTSADAGGLVTLFSYEREKPTSSPACIIIGGKYNGSSETTYYKVNLVDDDGNYYPIFRNFKYTVNINKVSAPGSSSVSEALVSLGSGDISTAFEYQSLTNISNGKSRIYVQYTDKLVVDNRSFTLKYKYIPDISTTTETTANSQGTTPGVTITLGEPGAMGQAIASYSVTDIDDGTDKSRTITIVPVAPSAFQKSQDIVITGTNASGETIQRTVTITVREKMTMSAYCNPSEVAATKGSAVDLHITLPAQLRKSIFPLLMNIEAQALSIAPVSTENLPVESGSSLVNSGKPGYHFVKTITWADYYKGDGTSVAESDYNTDIVCNFKTNTAASASAIIVNNEYFDDAATYFTNPGTEFTYDFNSLQFGSVRNDRTVDFQFNMLTVQPVTVTLGNLTVASSETSLTPTGTAGVYAYTPSKVGGQTLKLAVPSGVTTYDVTLSAEKYNTATKTSGIISIDFPTEWYEGGVTVSGNTVRPAIGFTSTLTTWVHFEDTDQKLVTFTIGEQTYIATSTSTTVQGGVTYYVYTLDYTPSTGGYHAVTVEASNGGSSAVKRTVSLPVWYKSGYTTGDALTSISYNTSTNYVLKNAKYNTYLYYNGSSLAVTSTLDANNSAYYFRFGGTSSETTLYSVGAGQYVSYDYSNNVPGLGSSGSTIQFYGYSSGKGFKMRDNNDNLIYVYRHLYQTSATSLALDKDNSVSGDEYQWNIIPIVDAYAAPM